DAAPPDAAALRIGARGRPAPRRASGGRLGQLPATARFAVVHARPPLPAAWRRCDPHVRRTRRCGGGRALHRGGADAVASRQHRRREIADHPSGVDHASPARRSRAARGRGAPRADPSVGRAGIGRRHTVGPRPGTRPLAIDMNRYPTIPLPWAALILCLALIGQEALFRWFGGEPSLSEASYRVLVMTIGVAALALIVLPQRRPAYVLGFVVCAALIAWALWLQYGKGIEPCPLCIFQRVAVIAVGIVFLLAALHNPKRSGAAFYAFLTVIAAGAGALFAARQIWLQSLP